MSEEREHGSIPRLKADDFELYCDETGSGFLVIFGDRGSRRSDTRPVSGACRALGRAMLVVPVGRVKC